MAAVHESRIKRRRRTKHTSGSKEIVRVCSTCSSETRWLSVDGLCWDCTVKAAKNKIPIQIDTSEDDPESADMYDYNTGGDW